MLTVRLKLYVVDMTPDYLDDLFHKLPDYVSYTYETYESGSAFVDHIKTKKLSGAVLHVVLLGYQFGYGQSHVMNGLEVLETALKFHPSLKFIMLAQTRELEYTIKARNMGAYAILYREELPLQIYSTLMALFSEQRVSLAKHNMYYMLRYFFLSLLLLFVMLFLYKYLFL